MDPEILKKIIQILRDEDKDAAIKLLEEMAVGTPADDGPADPTAASSDPPDPEQEAMSALSRDVVAKLNAKNAGEAAARFAEILSAHAETEKRARDLEASERRGLVADLVKIGAETPATAWVSTDAEGDARQPVKRLADEPIAELRSRVKSIAESRGIVLRSHTPPTRENENAPKVRKLSRAEEKFCKENNLTPAQFLERTRSAVKRIS